MLFSKVFSIEPRGFLSVRFNRRRVLTLLFIVVAAAARAGAATVTVRSGGDLQGAIDAAQPGDSILLEAGAVFVGPVTLPNKPGSEWITLRTSAPDSALPADGVRLTPAYASALPKIVTPGNAPALKTDAGAHHYRFVGIEFRPSTSSASVWNLIELGKWGAEQDELAEVPHHLVIDRCYLHGDPAGTLVRGVALNSAHTDIVNSYISEVKVTGYDSQAVMGWNGPGPFKIVNNYLEAAGENVMFGGSDPSIPNLVPSDIEVRGNHMFKPLAWRGVWTVKNLFELKNARRVTIEGNLLENNWLDAQNGFAVLFTVRNQYGGAPWSTVEDVTFRNNVVRHTASGVNILGRDNNYPSQQASRITISNNLFEDVSDSWGGQGAFLQVTDARDVTVDHNTVFHTGNAVFAYGVATTGFVFTNNLMAHNAYGLIGNGVGYGYPTLNLYFPGLSFARNLIAGAPEGSYPPDNFYPATLDAAGFADRIGGNYRLAASSPYKSAGTDGKDLGCDFDLLDAARGGATTNPTATPTPTPTPTPAPTPTGAAVFVKGDAATQGGWKGVYGAAGYQIVNEATAYPSYAQVSAEGSLSHTWVSSTSDPRALRKVAVEDRVAATWYAGGAFTLDVSLTDGQPHRFALYCVDWDARDRAQSVEVLDAGTGAVLDARSINSFTQGQYLVWELRGRVKLRVTRTAGANAVVSGLFFDNSAAPTPTPTPASLALISAAHDKAAQLAADASATEAQVSALAASVGQAYAAFASEQKQVQAGDQVEKALRTSVYFSLASDALALAGGHQTGVQNRLQITASRLGQALDLFAPATAQAGSQFAHAPTTNAPPVIGPAATASAASLAPLVAPSSLASITGDAQQTPLASASASAPRLDAASLPFELAGASVTIAGRAARLVYVSPAVVSFCVPAGLPQGEAEVIVTSQSGYVSRGTVTVGASAPGLFARADGTAVATGANGESPAAFDVTSQLNLGADKRTRLLLYGTGVAAAPSLNTDPSNDVRRADGTTLANAAESVSVEARASDGRAYLLAVEFAGAGGGAGLDQINVVLPAELRGAGAVTLTLAVGGRRSNSVTVNVR